MSRSGALHVVGIALLVCLIAGYVFIDPWAASSKRFDPAGLGADAVMVGDECGRMWLIEGRTDASSYRITAIASPYVAEFGLSAACAARATHDVTDMCGRRFTLHTDRSDQINVERHAPEFPAEVDDDCVVRMLLPPHEAIARARELDAAP